VLQRVPYWPGIFVNDGVELTVSPWDGVKGGVFAFFSKGSITFQGSAHIQATGLGFRGGAVTTAPSGTGLPGENHGGRTVAAEAGALGGGGGGLGDEHDCRPYGVAGGGGGHGQRGSSASDSLCGGQGGLAYGDDTLLQIFLGSGGGAGGMDNVTFDNPPGGQGGTGGGIVILKASEILGGDVFVRGNDGQGDTLPDACALFTNSVTRCWDFSGPGGGGAGGSALFLAPRSTANVHLDGGRGGYGVGAGAGQGGAGAAGRTVLR
jgi:hypothetical protein